MVFDQPPPAPKTSPYEKPPHAASPLNADRLTSPSSKSCMCTSTASNPARVKAAAISI